MDCLLDSLYTNFKKLVAQEETLVKRPLDRAGLPPHLPPRRARAAATALRLLRGGSHRLFAVLSQGTLALLRVCRLISLLRCSQPAYLIRNDVQKP